MTRTNTFLVIVVGLLFLLPILPVTAHAEVPGQMNYQGYLTDADGNPVADGDYEMVFSIWRDDSGVTSKLWEETQTVAVKNGTFNVVLGQSGNELNPADFDGELYLGLFVEDEKMIPWQPLTSVGFALKASKAEIAYDADTLDGYDSSYFLNPTQSMLIETSTPTVWGAALRAENTGMGAGLYGISYGQWGRGVWGVAMDSTHSNENYGGYFEARNEKGIGTYGEAKKEGDFENYGGYFKAAGNDGAGVYGEAPEKGVHGKGTAATGESYGVYGEAVTSSATGAGVYGTAPKKGVVGKATRMDGDCYGVWGETESPDGRGVYGIARSETGASNAVRGINESEEGRALYGWANNATTTKATYGVVGRADGEQGYGVWAKCSHATGETTAVYGEVTSPNGNAGHFKGKVTIDGPNAALISPFPRPAYDSGWVAISQGGEKELIHNVGGNVDNYVVDMLFKGDSLVGIHTFGYGGADDRMGAYYKSLTSYHVWVHRRPDDFAGWAENIRIRIWVYN